MIDWTPIAHRLNYPNEEAMWLDLYSVRKLSVGALAKKLDVSRNTIRTSLDRASVPVRKRGGSNNTKLQITDELVEEIRRHGIAVVARRLHLSYTTVYKRLYRVRGLKVADLQASVVREDEIG